MVGDVVKANIDRPLLAIGMMLFAYFCFSFIDAGAKWLALAGLPALQLSFMRYIGHFIISLVIMVRDGAHTSRFTSGKTTLLLIRGALLMLSTVFNFAALRYIPLTLTSTILFSAPIIICALSGPLLGERVGIWRWSAIIAGFAGILIAIRPFNEDFHWAVLLSLSGACSFAGYSILTRRLAGVVSTDTMQFYSGAVGTIILLPFALFEWQTPTSTGDWTIMIALGLLGWLGHQFLTTAHRFAPASTLSPYAYSFIMYLTIWSYLVFDHLPDLWTIAGALVIVTAGLTIWLRERRNARPI